MNLIEHSNIQHLVEQHFNSVCPKLKNIKNVKGRTVEYRSSSVKEKIQKMVEKYRNRKAIHLFNYFNKNFETLIKGDVGKLSIHKRNIDRIIRSHGLSLKSNTELYKDVSICFDYESYKTKGIPYEILMQLSVNACPYCNRQFINTFVSKEGRTRATLDHFYAQSTHPYFAVSFYNLIPACYSCNSSIKGKKEFKLSSHLHPYKDSFESVIRFTINYKKGSNTRKYIAEFFRDSDYLEIDFVRSNTATVSSYRRASKNVEDLCLKGLYNLHKDFIVEILQKHVVYNESGYAKNLAKQYPKIFSSDHDILRMILGNHMFPADFNKRPFSRLTRDIAQELGFLDLMTK